jgi:hypothetical protein
MSDNIQPGKILPVPDPTSLTTTQLLHEIAVLKELLETKNTATRHKIKGITNQLALALAATKEAEIHRKELVDFQLKAVEALTSERFTGIAKQLQERDDRLKESQAVAAQGIVIGLQAQKEAAAKTEVSLADSLKGLSALVDKTIAGLTDKVNILQSRVDKNESYQGGIGAHKSEEKQNIGLVIAIVSVVSVLFSSVVASLVAFALRTHT